MSSRGARANPRGGGRSRQRAREVDEAVAKLTVVATDRLIAQRAGLLLGPARRGFESAVDAFVAATALAMRPAVIVTGDVTDLRALCAGQPDVSVRDLGG